MNFNFKDCQRGLILGASSGIGSAIVESLQTKYQHLEILTPQRQSNELLDELWWQSYIKEFSDIDFFINAIGILSDEQGPEKSVRDLCLDRTNYVFEVNCYINLLAMKYLKRKFSRKDGALFCVLSAKVGSIEDNRLGGWYSYRMSKAALNMALKTFSLENKSSQPNLICIAQHPGTTKTQLTQKYLKNISYKVKNTEETASILIDLWEGLTPAHSGLFLNWDGKELPW